AIEKWSQQGFHAQHFFALISTTEATIYQGEYAEAWQMLNQQWPALSGSLLLRAQMLRIESVQLRARSAIALAAKDERQSGSLLKIAAGIANKVAREKTGYGNAMAALLQAGIASCRGNRKLSGELAEVAERGFDQQHMPLYMASARYARGL